MIRIIFTLVLVFLSSLVLCQFEVEMTPEGIVFPRVSTVVRDNLTAVQGQCIYNTDSRTVDCYDGVSTWVSSIGSGPAVSHVIIDNDLDTKVDVDSNGDNVIWFHLGGIDRWRFVGSRLEPINSGNSTYIGGSAGLNDDLNNRSNVGVGQNTLKSNTQGKLNVAVGNNSMVNNISGNYNVALGNYCLRDNLTGFLNIAIGNLALHRNTTGKYNISLGSNTLNSNTTGNHNIGLGHFCLRDNLQGHYNVSLGAHSSQANTTGANNVAIGRSALLHNKIGMNNVAIGFVANTNSASYSNTIGIGYGSYITASNQARIGNSSTNSIGGYVGWSTLSDQRVKGDIKEDVVGLDFIKLLRPVTYKLKFDEIPSASEEGVSHPVRVDSVSLDMVRTGFIAQEVEAAAAELGFNFSGIDAPQNDNDFYSLRYSEFTVPLVKAIQELSEENENLQEELRAMKKEMQEIKRLIEGK